MVAQTIALPNIRKMFIPDPGYEIAEADLSGAEAQVVAWEANDEDLKQAFRSGINVHIKNARDVFPEKIKGWSDEAIKATSYPGGIYYTCKRCVHATHNGAAPKGLSQQIGIPIRDAENFQRIWFGLHPTIPKYKDRVNSQLLGTYDWPDGIKRSRTVFNSFGYRIIYFDRIKSLLPQALAWIPQSTVGITSVKGGTQLHATVPWVEILLQVHDSLVFQYPIARSTNKDLAIIKSALEVTCPYDDPLVIPWTLKTSRISWGHCESRKW
jgi:DNA polymerase-1